MWRASDRTVDSDLKTPMAGVFHKRLIVFVKVSAAPVLDGGQSVR